MTGPFAHLRLLGDREAVNARTPTLDHIVIDRGAQVAAEVRGLGRGGARLAAQEVGGRPAAGDWSGRFRCGAARSGQRPPRPAPPDGAGAVTERPCQPHYVVTASEFAAQVVPALLNAPTMKYSVVPAGSPVTVQPVLPPPTVPICFHAP